MRGMGCHSSGSAAPCRKGDSYSYSYSCWNIGIVSPFQDVDQTDHTLLETCPNQPDNHYTNTELHGIWPTWNPAKSMNLNIRQSFGTILLLLLLIRFSGYSPLSPLQRLSTTQLITQSSGARIDVRCQRACPIGLGMEIRIPQRSAHAQ